MGVGGRHIYFLLYYSQNCSLGKNWTTTYRVPLPPVYYILICLYPDTFQCMFIHSLNVSPQACGLWLFLFSCLLVLHQFDFLFLFSPCSPSVFSSWILRPSWGFPLPSSSFGLYPSGFSLPRGFLSFPCSLLFLPLLFSGLQVIGKIPRFRGGACYSVLASKLLENSGDTPQGFSVLSGGLCLLSPTEPRQMH